MRFAWLAWSNPVAAWWSFLVLVSLGNIGLWLVLYHRFRGRRTGGGIFGLEPMLLLCAAYVFGCAFRAVLPRADVQRICLFDTWLSSVALGRSVATVAEICFVAQWAIVLSLLGAMVNSDAVRGIARTIVPLIVLAECCSWYAVISTNFLANAVENSIWAIAFGLIAVALLRLVEEFRGAMRLAIAAALIGVSAYLAFLVTIDVPMYIGRWQADLAAGKERLGWLAGLYDVAARWTVTRDFAQWRDEMAWMSLYFSAAVWSSVALSTLYLLQDHAGRLRAAPTASRRVAAWFAGTYGWR